jgi:hypothetical protein
MTTKKQLKRKTRLPGKSNEQMFKLMIRLTILILMFTGVQEIRAQSDPSPTQTVGTGNEPYLVTATPGSTYTWSVSPGTSGNEWSINGTGNSITVDWNSTGVYTLSVVERSAQGCTGDPVQVVVTVNEMPVVTATPSSEAICSGSATSISLSSNLGNTTFTWTAALTSGTATGFSDGTGPEISQTLTNTSGVPATVTYTVTPTANSLSGNPVTVVVTVNPLPSTSPIYHN